MRDNKYIQKDRIKELMERQLAELSNEAQSLEEKQIKNVFRECNRKNTHPDLLIVVPVAVLLICLLGVYGFLIYFRFFQ